MAVGGRSLHVVIRQERFVARLFADEFEVDGCVELIGDPFSNLRQEFNILVTIHLKNPLAVRRTSCLVRKPEHAHESTT